MAQAQNQSTLRLVVRGRIAHITQRNGESGTTFRTLLRTPAADEYSPPGTFELRSKRRLGATGDEVEVECDLLGYVRSYQNKEGQTVRTAEHVLQVA